MNLPAHEPALCDDDQYRHPEQIALAWHASNAARGLEGAQHLAQARGGQARAHFAPTHGRLTTMGRERGMGRVAGASGHKVARSGASRRQEPQLRPPRQPRARAAAHTLTHTTPENPRPLQAALRLRGLRRLYAAWQRGRRRTGRSLKGIERRRGSRRAPSAPPGPCESAPMTMEESILRAAARRYGRSQPLGRSLLFSSVNCSRGCIYIYIYTHSQMR